MTRALRTHATAATAALVLATALPQAQANVLTFDDLSGTQFFLANYHGFRFGTNNIDTTAWFHTDAPNPDFTPHSGASYVATDFRLYTGAPFEPTQAIRSATDFRFDGAWFSGDDQVRYKLYNNGTLVYTSPDSVALSATPVFVASGYNSFVDAVVIEGKQGFYAMDDFKYTPAPVPEPASFAMFAVGLLGLAVVSRRASR